MLHSYIFLLIIGWKVLLHPFYISLTDIRYNTQNQNLEIAQKIFWDDLEVALSESSSSKVDFLNPSDPEKLNKMAGEYLLAANAIEVNGQKIELKYLGYEIEEDAAWFYMETGKIPFPKAVSIKNTVLFNQFDGQQNIVNFYLDKKPKSLILYKDSETGELVF